MTSEINLKFAAFGRWILTQHRGNLNDIGDLDGGEIQDAAIRFGLLHEVEVTEPCSEDCCNCAEYYDEFPAKCLREVYPVVKEEE